jgi:tetratricopeptide (TPR) repeat protein
MFVRWRTVLLFGVALALAVFAAHAPLPERSPRPILSPSNGSCSRECLNTAEDAEAMMFKAAGWETERPYPPEDMKLAAAIALPTYNEAVELCPACAEAYAKRASARAWAGDRRGAAEDARFVIANGLGEWRVQEGLVHFLEGEERRSFLRVLSKRPGADMTSVAWQLADGYFDEGLFPKYIAELEKLASQPERIEDRRDLAGLYERIGLGYEASEDPASAERAYQKAIEAMSQAPNIRKLEPMKALALLRIRKGDLEGAKKVIQQSSALESEWIMHLSLLDALDAREVDREVLRARLTALSEEGYEAFVLGLGLVRLGKIDEGLTHLERFVTWADAPPSEWERAQRFERGPTLRWEITRAKQVIAETRKPRNHR